LKFKQWVVRTLAAVALTVASVLTGVMGIQQSASAYDDTCRIGAGAPLAYYFHSYSWGAMNCQNGNVPDLLNPRVKFFQCGKDCDGLNQQVGNNAGSAANWDTRCSVTVWFHANYQGARTTMGPTGTSTFYSETLGAVNNDNRSQNWSC
jgi:hypothetical protein